MSTDLCLVMVGFVKTRALSLRGGTGDVHRSVFSDGRFCED